MSADRHEPFRALLAERMDGPLDASDAARLEGHLADCPSCRSVAHDYEVDRERMRSVRVPVPPRDLWARTSAALDREIADDADPLLGGAFPGGGGRRQLRLAGGSLLTALVILALTGGRLLPEAPTGLATATPFAIPAQSVSYVGLANGQLTFYRADVDAVCPPPKLDCADGPDGEPVSLGSTVHAREMAINPAGQLFISGRDDLGAEVFAIVTLPDEEAEPTVGGSGSPEASADAPATADATNDDDPSRTRNPDLGQPDPPTPEPTDGADVLPSRSPDPGDPSAAPSITPPPGPAAVASSRSILSDAIATGAAAAWSPDGSTLAFSAMPADRSRGSDVYLWRPGDEQAQPLTKDHGSYFASWSGSRVIVSRIEGEGPDPGGEFAQTVAIDPESDEVRPVDLDRAWLPTVDPTGRFVIYWRGRLAAQAGLATPDDGRLYLADWTNVDPWPTRAPDADHGAAPDKGGAAGATETAASDATPAEEASPAEDAAPPKDASPADPPVAAPDAEASATGPDQPEADTTGADATAGSDGADPAASADTDAPPDVADANGSTDAGRGGSSEAPRATAAPFLIERPRAVSGQTRDWVVRWTATGDAYAVWTSDPGSKLRGSLVVHSAPSADAPVGATLVERVRASRSFGLGEQRIAWVAPLADGDGELWVSAWGTRGQGSVKLRRLDSWEVVPAY